MNEVLFTLVGAVLLTIVALSAGIGMGIKWTRDDMIEAGVGEYYIDKNNERQFRIKKK